MPGREVALHNEPLDRGGQVQQANRVGDGGTGPAHPGGDLFLRQAEVVHQLAIGRSLLQGVEVLAVDVLDDRSLKRPLVVGGANQSGNAPQAGPLGGPPATLPCNNLISFYCFSDNDRLYHPDLGYRLGQGREGLLVEPVPRLVGVGHDLDYVDVLEGRPDRVGLSGDQGPEAPPQATTACHGAPPLPGRDMRSLPWIENRRE